MGWAKRLAEFANVIYRFGFVVNVMAQCPSEASCCGTGVRKIARYEWTEALKLLVFFANEGFKSGQVIALVLVTYTPILELVTERAVQVSRSRNWQAASDRHL